MVIELTGLYFCKTLIPAAASSAISTVISPLSSLRCPRRFNISPSPKLSPLTPIPEAASRFFFWPVSFSSPLVRFLIFFSASFHLLQPLIYIFFLLFLRRSWRQARVTQAALGPQTPSPHRGTETAFTGGKYSLFYLFSNPISHLGSYFIVF